MLSIGHLFFLSVTAFVSLSILLTVEKKIGRRVLFGGLRGFLDKIIVKITTFFGYWFGYFSRHVIKLSWYYSVHRFLRLLLTSLIKTYDRLEAIFLKNRDKAKIIKKEKKKIEQEGHLKIVADHKASVALTESQKKKLLAKKLEKG